MKKSATTFPEKYPGEFGIVHVVINTENILDTVKQIKCCTLKTCKSNGKSQWVHEKLCCVLIWVQILHVFRALMSEEPKSHCKYCNISLRSTNNFNTWPLNISNSLGIDTDIAGISIDSLFGPYLMIQASVACRS